MRSNARHVLGWVLIVVLMAVALGGCGEFRRQAADAQARLDDAIEQAQIAEDAAAQNAARIIELSHRVDVLETIVNELTNGTNESSEDDTQTNDE